MSRLPKYRRLYLLKLDEGYLQRIITNTGLECADGFVVAALDMDDARGLAADQAGDETARAWYDPERSSCRLIADRTTERGVVLRSFNAK